MHKSIIFFIALCSTSALYSSVDYVRAKRGVYPKDRKSQCANDLLNYTISYLDPDLQNQKTQYADDILALVRQCPGNFHEQAHKAGSLVTPEIYAEYRSCGKLRAFACNFYRERVQAAELLKHKSSLLYTLITRDAS